VKQEPADDGPDHADDEIGDNAVRLGAHQLAGQETGHEPYQKKDNDSVHRGIPAWLSRSEFWPQYAAPNRYNK
jgi:hypothetical protein